MIDIKIAVRDFPPAPQAARYSTADTDLGTLLDDSAARAPSKNAMSPLRGRCLLHLLTIT